MSDIDNFRKVYVQAQRLQDTAQQLKRIQTVYAGQAGNGLKGFIKSGEIDAVYMLRSITGKPKFGTSVINKIADVSYPAPQSDQIITEYKKAHVLLFSSRECKRSGLYFN